MRWAQPLIALLGLGTCLTSLAIPFSATMAAAQWPGWLMAFQLAAAAGLLVGGLSNPDAALSIEDQLWNEVEPEEIDYREIVDEFHGARTKLRGFTRDLMDASGPNPVDRGMMVIAVLICPVVSLFGPSFMPLLLGWTWALLHQVRRLGSRRLRS